MTEITASERRLSAALDRIDRVLEAGTRRDSNPLSDGPADAETEALRDEIDRLTQALAETEARQRQTMDDAARLSAANEDLAAANRQLIEARDTGGVTSDEALEALEAEVTALRAARAAEMAQMSEIMAELERLLVTAPEDGGQPEDGDR